MYTKILTFVGEIAGKEAVKHLIKSHLSPKDAAAWNEMLGLEKQDKITPKLEWIEQMLADVSRVVKDTQIMTVFASYNLASDKLGVFLDEFKAAHENREHDAAGYQNACRKIVAENGVTKQIALMQKALFEPKAPSNEAFIQAYARILRDDQTEVFQYLRRIDAVAKSFQAQVIAGLAVRAVAVDVIGSHQDVEFGSERLKPAQTVLESIVAVPQRLVDTIDGWVAQGTPVRIRHNQSGNFLSVNKQGRHTSSGPLKESYHDESAPQVFLWPKAKGAIFSYYEVSGAGVMNPGTVRDYKLEITDNIQLWKIHKTQHADGHTTLRFENMASQSNLAGIVDNHLRVDEGTKDAQFAVILDKDAPNQESPPCMIRHEGDGLALDGNGRTAYGLPIARDYNNFYQKWSLLPK